MTRVMFWHGWAWTKSSQHDLASDDLASEDSASEDSASEDSASEDSASDDRYQFHPLGTSTTIRLIQVLRERVQGCIACKIYHFDEKQQRTIKYHALSYAWGNPKPIRQIYLQDQGNECRPFPLHENLWQFLDHAWRHKMFDQLFWTDYLCLDQKGHEEISQQVPRMHAIYRNAELVFIWLQLKEEEQEALCKVMWLRRLPKLVQRVLRTKIDKRLYGYRCEIWGAMEENRYWGRVWIVQEVVVATKVCVTAGDISIDLDELRVLIEPFRETDVPAGTPSIWVLCDMRDVGGKMPLWRILSEFKGYRSSRPADRVYGLLGLVEDREDGSSPVDNIQVDYDRPMWHVLLDAMFESSPPLTKLREATQGLGPWDTYKGISILEDYIRSSTTTQRHRDLARIALQTFKAFSVIKNVPNAPFSWLMRHILDDIESAETWQPTWGQSAALIGLVLAQKNRSPTDHSITRSQSEGDVSSPWRCAVHRSHDGDRVGPGSYQLVCFLKTSWSRPGVVDACGEQSQSCDGQIMTLEIPGSQLRFEIISVINRRDEWWVRLERMESEP